MHAARLAALACLLLATVAHAAELRTFPLTVHAVAGASRADLDLRVELANRVFAEAGVAFAIANVVPLDAQHAGLVTRDDRDALGQYATPRTVHVFVVDSLMDVDTPPLARGGVHWRDRGRPGVRYVILVARAPSWVLAHELGHYFGNGHSNVAGNLMSYTRGEGDPFLDAAQLGRIRRSAQRIARAFRLP